MGSWYYLGGVKLVVADLGLLLEHYPVGLTAIVIYLLGILAMIPVAIKICLSDDIIENPDALTPPLDLLAKNFWSLFFSCVFWPLDVFIFCVAIKLAHRELLIWVAILTAMFVGFVIITNPSSDTLLTNLEHGSWARAREAKYQLRARADPETIVPLINLVQTSGSLNVRDHAVDALRNLEDERVLKLLLTLFSGPRSEARSSARSIFLSYKSPKYIPLCYIVPHSNQLSSLPILVWRSYPRVCRG